MLIAHLATFALAVVLTTWGASLVLRAAACRAATLRSKPPFSWMFRGSSVWDPRPEAVGAARAGFTTLLGLVALAAGAASFGLRLHLDASRMPTMMDTLMASMAGLVASAAAAALGLGLFADRAGGRLRCPRCWYDMQGQPSLQCSECGHVAKHQRDLQRTRRSPGMLILAMALLAVSALPSIVAGYVANSWLGAMPTWSLILFANRVPASWVTPSTGSERFGTLEDRWELMNPLERWLMLRRMEGEVSRNYGVLGSGGIAPPFSNLISLAQREPQIAAYAVRTPQGVRNMRRRWHELMTRDASVISDAEMDELGMLSDQLAVLAYTGVRVAAADIRSDSAPRVSDALVQRIVNRAMQPRRGASLSASVLQCRLAEPQRAMQRVLDAFSARVNQQKRANEFVNMISRLISGDPAHAGAVHAYLASATADQQTELLRNLALVIPDRLIERDVIMSLRQSPDGRVSTLANLVQLPGDVASADPCGMIIEAYNRERQGDLTLWWLLKQHQCDLRQAVPGMVRDLSTGGQDLIAEIAAAIIVQEVCDPRLIEPLEQVLAGRTTYNVELVYKALLHVDPQFDATTFGASGATAVNP